MLAFTLAVLAVTLNSNLFGIIMVGDLPTKFGVCAVFCFNPAGSQLGCKTPHPLDRGC